MSALQDQDCSLDCFNCGEQSPGAANSSLCETAAAAAGWVIGLDLDTGGAPVYACPDCAVFLENPLPVCRSHIGGAS